MSLMMLHIGTESERRSTIAKVSKAKDDRYVPQLLAMLDGNEPQAVRRYCVRALGSIGSKAATERLHEMLDQERGLILGELAKALADIGFREARPSIKDLVDHKDEWVRLCAVHALKVIDK